jgi:hypothetical protein
MLALTLLLDEYSLLFNLKKIKFPVLSNRAQNKLILTAPFFYWELLFY